ncbi:MAG: hypothetical protein HN742_23905 [Lentisphaerae bacterium]|nr:hypothetical protein [Lentisphaerota bacterium]MBT5612785.1 hypothetical protein [Lentisphaerota bacterium]MBT7057611.1 hypothetical protein [Lentisphaerota bacterium]MBT7844942.1 hypothetical protein [Lentisphaerota bacterium]
MSKDSVRRDFNARTFALGLLSLALLAVWSHWHNVISVNRTALNDNSPPIGGVGVFLGVFLIILLFELLNKKVKLPRGELIVIYAMLMVAAPWMGHGIWYRCIGLIYTVPRDNNQARLFHHYSDKLWPHGPQLVDNGGFERDPPLEGYYLAIAPTKDEEGVAAELPDPEHVTVEDLEDNAQGLKRCVQLCTTDFEMVLLKYRVPRQKDGKDVLVPGENYHLSYFVKIDESKGGTMLNCYVLTDKDDKFNVNSLNRDTKVSFSAPSGFDPVCHAQVVIPDRLDEYMDIVFEFRGAGSARISDLRLYNNEAIQSLYQGRNEVRASDYEKLPLNQRARVDIRPDKTFSFAGILSRMRGMIPMREWLQPAACWGTMIMALFAALLALMVIMRRQWAENERFSFPMLIFPRALLEQEEDENGRVVFALFKKRAMWVGFGISVFLISLQGLHHYFRVPMISSQVDIAKFFENNRPLYSFFRGFYWHPFNVSLIVLPIAFFIELELLASILLCFFVCSLPFYLREEMFTSWKSIKDFPFVREQHTGAYVALAVITLYAARRHLKLVFLKAFGRETGEEDFDDRDEAWTYRRALIVFGGAMLFLCCWMQYVEVGFLKGLLYFTFIVACGLSTARIRTECGTPWTYLTPYTPLIIFSAAGGAYLFGMDMFVIMIVSGGFLCSASYLMCAPTQVEMLQLSKLFKVSPRCVARGAMVGALGGLLFGGYFLLSIAYSKGAMNVPYIGDWAANQRFQVRLVNREVAFQDQRYQKAHDDGEPYGNFVQRPQAWALGISFVVTVLLFVAKSLWVSFPLHPVGYILANTYFINMVWGSLFTAMIIKFVALKAGGVMIVRKTMTPFFVGVFLGAVSMYLFWDGIGLILNAFGYMDTFCVPHRL